MDIKIEQFGLIIDLVPLLSQKFLNKKIYLKLAPKELNPTHMRTLVFIHFHNNMTMNEISNMLSIEKGSFTPVANKLIELDYVKKVPSEKDKRKSYLLLTKKGLDLVLLIKQNYIDDFSSKIETLSEKDKNTLLTSTKSLLNVLNKL